MSKFWLKFLLWSLALLVLLFVVIRGLYTNLALAVLAGLLALLLIALLSIYVWRDLKEKRLARQLATELAGANVRLERIDQIKTEFVSIASHQLRGPVTAIRGYASMLLEGSYGPLADKQKEAIERIAEAARGMSFLVEDYLNVSRIEAGRMKYEITRHDFKELVENTVSEMLPVAVHKGVTLVFNSPVVEPCMISTDLGKTKQIVQNLIDNAIKYTPKGGVIRAKLEKGESRKFRLSIIDSGIGIAPDQLTSVFNKFERAKNANSVNVTGTGLGLYIARTMAEAMGGNITVSSEGEGKGTSFIVEFPMVE